MPAKDALRSAEAITAEARRKMKRELRRWPGANMAVVRDAAGDLEQAAKMLRNLAKPIEED